MENPINENDNTASTDKAAEPSIFDGVAGFMSGCVKNLKRDLRNDEVLFALSFPLISAWLAMIALEASAMEWMTFAILWVISYLSLSRFSRKSTRRTDGQSLGAGSAILYGFLASLIAVLFVGLGQLSSGISRTTGAFKDAQVTLAYSAIYAVDPERKAGFNFLTEKSSRELFQVEVPSKVLQKNNWGEGTRMYFMHDYPVISIPAAKFIGYDATDFQIGLVCPKFSQEFLDASVVEYVSDGSLTEFEKPSIRIDAEYCEKLATLDFPTAHVRFK